MKQITALKLTCVAAFVASLGAGCASSGYARYDADSTNQDGMGVSASADVGTDSSASSSTMVASDVDTEGEERITVSALSFNPETRANWVNKFPFYDQAWNLRVIETYTFTPPDGDADLRASVDTDNEFRTSTEPGSVYVEAAGGSGTRVIQHSPNPR